MLAEPRSASEQFPLAAGKDALFVEFAAIEKTLRGSKTGLNQRPSFRFQQSLIKANLNSKTVAESMPGLTMRFFGFHSRVNRIGNSVKRFTNSQRQLIGQGTVLGIAVKRGIIGKLTFAAIACVQPKNWTADTAL
jgi:hypothetical protein